MRGRGGLGFTFLVLTPGPVPLPSLGILPSVPVSGTQPRIRADETSCYEIHEDHREDQGDGLDGCGCRLDCEESFG